VPVIETVGESCSGFGDASITVDTVTGGVPPYLYAINGGVFGLQDQFTNLLPGMYTLAIQDAQGCELTVNVFASPATTLWLDLGVDQQIVLGDSLRLTPNTNAAIDTLIWTMAPGISCTDCLEPYVQPLEETTYSLTIIDINGCTVSDQVVVRVDKTARVFIPDVFSPNGDGINDNLMIQAGPGVDFVRAFKVYDRWGGTVFSAENFQPNVPDPLFTWNGTYRGEAVNAGVYIYFAEIIMTDGRTIVEKGEVVLLR
jgi:gliding motility-associated-like protein